MHLEFTDEQLELRDSARATLARECPPRLVREVALSGADAEGFRTQLSWLGWPALTIDVDLGGLGRSFVDLAVVLEELGRVAAPGPFLATMTQFVPAVREAGTPAQVHRFLSAVAARQLNGTLALHEGGRWDPFSIGATATRDGDGWILSGRKRQVLSCAEVDEIVVAARRSSGTLGLFVVPAAEVSFTRVDSLDGTRSLGNLELDGVWVPDARMLGDPEAAVDVTPAVAATIAEATVGLALDTIGVCGELFESALEVALDRAGRAAGACQRLITARSLEIHGRGPRRADAQLWVRRAQAGELLLGSSADHHRIVADDLFCVPKRQPASTGLAAVLGL